MMREVLSGTLKSDERHFSSVNQDYNLIESFKKTFKRAKRKLKVDKGLVIKN
jgi:hypothetical protein